MSQSLALSQSPFPSFAAKRPVRPALLLAVLMALPAASLPRMAQAAPTALTETGQLVIAGVPANGSYDFQFSLFNAQAGGAQVGATVTVLNVPVTGGVYYAEVNFGSAFAAGITLYVQTAYRTAGVGAYTVQAPRHQAPNSAFADYAAVSGTTQGLQTKAVSAAIPTLGQALVYNGTLWAPAAVPAGPKGATGATGAVGAKGATGATGVAGAKGATGATGLAGPAYTAGAGLTLSSSKFSIPSSGVTAAMLGAGSVGPGAIAVPLNLTGASSLPVLSGTNTNASGAGVSGQNTSTGASGLLGGTEPVSGLSLPVGVFGKDVSQGGVGVFGNSAAGYGVFGNSTSSGVGGVTGVSSGGGLDLNGTSYGVKGISGSGDGVYGQSNTGDGVYGISGAGTGGDFLSGGTNGIRSESTADGGNGIAAVANVGTSAFGIYAISASGYAGVFGGKVKVAGDLIVTGSITAGTKDFKIDDPLDPAGKYLSHACIESDQMADLYSGNAVTDGAGNAVVTLPRWFEALNKDFRYQLTVVGQFAQAVVAAKVHSNAFGIKTDKPNVEVSWQVTGVRQDAYALAHPLQVEEDKPVSEQGLFLHPKEQGQPEEQGIAYQQQKAHEAHTAKRP